MKLKRDRETEREKKNYVKTLLKGAVLGPIVRLLRDPNTLLVWAHRCYCFWAHWDQMITEHVFRRFYSLFIKHWPAASDVNSKELTRPEQIP